jgi:hypothetical protein
MLAKKACFTAKAPQMDGSWKEKRGRKGREKGVTQGLFGGNQIELADYDTILVFSFLDPAGHPHHPRAGVEMDDAAFGKHAFELAAVPHAG